MDGDVAPRRRPARRLRAPRRAARARRGARGARARSPDLARAPTSTCCGSARCRRHWVRSAASSPGRVRYTELLVNRARSLHLHDRVQPGRHRGRARRAAGRPRAGGRRAGPSACARTSTGSGPATRRRSSRTSAGARPRGRGGRPRSLDRGLLVTADPPADRARRARPACGSRCRPRTARRRSTRSPAHCAISSRESESDPAPHAGARRRHRHRGGQDLVDGARCGASCAAAGRRGRGPQTGAVGRPGRRAHRRRACSPPPPARTAHGLPAASLLRGWRGRRRWPPTRLGAPAVHGRRPRRRDRRGPTASTSGWSREWAGRGRRSPPTATPSTSRGARARPRGARRRRRARHHQRGQAVGKRARAVAGGRRVQPLAARRPAPAQPRLPRRRRLRPRHQPGGVGSAPHVSWKSRRPSLTYSGNSSDASARATWPG